MDGNSIDSNERSKFTIDPRLLQLRREVHDRELIERTSTPGDDAAIARMNAWRWPDSHASAGVTPTRFSKEDIGPSNELIDLIAPVNVRRLQTIDLTGEDYASTAMEAVEQDMRRATISESTNAPVGVIDHAGDTVEEQQLQAEKRSVGPIRRMVDESLKQYFVGMVNKDGQVVKKQ